MLKGEVNVITLAMKAFWKKVFRKLPLQFDQQNLDVQ
jgi:hypothetical protein